MVKTINDWVYRMHGWEGITKNTSEGQILMPLHHTTVQDTSQPYIILDIIRDYYVISWEIIVPQIMVTLSSDTTKTTGQQSAVLIHLEQRSTLSLLLIDLLETSEAAIALVELRRVSKTNGLGFNERQPCILLNSAISHCDIADLWYEDVRPDHFIQNGFFYKFGNDSRLLKCLLSMTVMVISYLDSAGKRELKPDGQTTKWFLSNTLTIGTIKLIQRM